MTVSSSINKAGPYAGNGVTAAFAFAFYTQAAADLSVVRTDPSGIDTPLTFGPDYTVTLNPDQTTTPGGTVTLAVAPATGYQVTILRSIALTQGSSLPNQGGWYPRVVENALDKLTMAQQQLAELVSRTVKVGVAAAQTPDQMIATITASASSSLANASAAASSATGAATSATSASGSASAASASAGAAATSAAQAAAYAASRGGGIVRSPRNSNTILDIADATNLIDYTGGAFTQTFKPAATLANGWFVYLRNSGTGVITLDPNASETIDGATTFALQPDQQVLLQCDGSNFYTAVKNQPPMALLATISVTAAATIDLLNVFSSNYDFYLIIAEGILPAVGTASLLMRVAVAGAADTSSNYYNGAQWSSSAYTVSDPFLLLSTMVDHTQGGNFKLEVHNANDAVGIKSFVTDLIYDTGSGYYNQGRAAVYKAANAISGFRLYWADGQNFAARGKIRVYGLKNF